ncbi:hypothetical protein DLAC_08947 [Tieghemostelium lacteum]|uniref:Uncharacterized protein n=1 Tax=Tieghemostelium lacteum TaxID=361077 RepID=A0A151Z8R9_TIELA|nr:hypothetical protein DLAC_08947 [Tieghemostelium lacteum]|eukprot:KYQ90336.1 hypothetical protein DLAC_08947 [Tieghemostelium lacteum]
MKNRDTLYKECCSKDLSVFSERVNLKIKDIWDSHDMIVLPDLDSGSDQICRVLKQLSEDIGSLIYKFNELSIIDLEEPQEILPQQQVKKEEEEIECIVRSERRLDEVKVELWSYDDRLEVYQPIGTEDGLVKLKTQIQSMVNSVHQYNHNFIFLDLVYKYIFDRETMLNELIGLLGRYSSMDTAMVPLLRDIVVMVCQDKLFGICNDLSIVFRACKGENSPLSEKFYREMESYQKKLRNKAETLKKLSDLETNDGELFRLKLSIQSRLEVAYDELESLYAKYEKSTDNIIKRMAFLTRMKAIGIDELMVSYNQLFAKCRYVKFSDFTMAFENLLPDYIRGQTTREDFQLFFADLDDFVNNLHWGVFDGLSDEETLSMLQEKLSKCQEISIKICLALQVNKFISEQVAIVEKLDALFGSEFYGDEAQRGYKKLKRAFKRIQDLPKKGEVDPSKLQSLVNCGLVSYSRKFMDARDWLISYMESITTSSSDEAEVEDDDDMMVCD